MSKPVANRSRVSSLAALNAHIARASREARAADDGAVADTDPWPELRSARRFRETWERLGAEQQVQRARERAPQNAGPLNPQRLMMETLARMGELSPHYLRRFLAHTQTLLWLEQAQDQLRTARTGKAGASTGSKMPPVRGTRRR